MKNLILAAIRNSIPYVKELKSIAGTTNGCLLMQQLDYWFKTYPDGYYKFLEPCDHTKFQFGQSWTEELGFSVDEFRCAFDRIGVRYTSKTAYEKADDKFQEKFYCSYFNKIEGTTHYFRNHELADRAIAEALNCSPELLMRTTEKANSRRWGNPIYGDGETQSRIHRSRDYNREYVQRRRRREAGHTRHAGRY